MLKYLLKRMIFMIPQAIILSLAIFFMTSPAIRLFLNGLMTFDELLESFRGLAEGYFYWLGNFMMGDMGRSWQFQMPVAELIQWRLYNTLFLALLALFMMYLIAIPLALYCARHAENFKGRLLVAVSYVGFAVPMFIFTIFAMYFFGFRLRWFPTGGSVPPGLNAQLPGYWLGRLHHMILPAFCVAVVTMMPTFHYLRTEMVQFSNHPMTSSARAKGCSERRLYYKHIFKNSLLPVTSSFGFQLAALLGGALFVEMLFSYPGMGGLFLWALQGADQEVVSALIMIYSGAAMIGSCLSDVMTVWIDPRIRLK